MKNHSSSFLTIFLVLSLIYGCTPVAPVPTSTPSSIPPTFTLTTTPTTTPIPGIVLPIRGVFVHQFDRRGYPSGYYSGEILNDFNEFDPVIGQTVVEEVSLQLDAMKQMGVNTIAFELRTTDPTYIPGPFSPPSCNIPPTLGAQYPQPTTLEMDNLISFFDLLQSKDMKIILILTNTHIEGQSSPENTLWLGTILTTVKAHPALELISFGGSTHLVDTTGDGIDDACGIPAEAALWEGPTSTAAKYVAWAIKYAHSLGLPYRKLSAEAIIGDYYTLNQGPAGPSATGGHLWDPLYVLKNIFDSLSIPDSERTYAVSFYEHRKCLNARHLPCTDANPHEWAVETVNNLFNTIGRENGARVIAVEMGWMTNQPELTSEGLKYIPIEEESNMNPIEVNWSTELAFESLIWIIQNYGIEGACFYSWVNGSHLEELNPINSARIKQRGTEYSYNPIKDFLETLYTRGQTDDLILSEDAISPTFSSVSITPNVVKNGETLEIFTDLEETHLFVTVDISQLDSSQIKRIALMDQGDGTYKATVKINLWNEADNGIKEIPFYAMDYWSNPSILSINVELDNPIPVKDKFAPEDFFDGKSLDKNKWGIDIAGGALVQQDGRLVVSTDNQQAYSSARIQSNWAFQGDFDILVEFQIGEGWTVPTREHIDGAFLGVNIEGQSYHITRLRTCDQDKVFSWSTLGTLIGEMSTDTLTGRYRLIRTGSTLMLLFDFGTGWQKLVSTTVPTSLAKVYFGNGSINASHAFITYFDNFQINSGLTTYKP